MKKLFVATLTIEVVVLAENEKTALDVVHSNRYDIRAEEPDVSISPMDYYPDGYEDECRPYGGEQTIGELIAAGAAPRLKLKTTGTT